MITRSPGDTTAIIACSTACLAPLLTTTSSGLYFTCLRDHRSAAMARRRFALPDTPVYLVSPSRA